jgi:hypothetical protein
MLRFATSDAAETFSGPVSAADFAGHLIGKNPYIKAVG